MRGTVGTFVTLLALAAPAHAKRYLTDEEALAKAFPEATSFVREERELSPEVRKDVESRLARAVPEGRFTFHTAKKGDAVLGRGLFVDEIGKTMPITLLVGVTADGRVTAVELVEFRESRGDGIARTSFREQFRGKTLADPLKVGKDIRAVTSSTMSSDAACLAVRKALVLVQALFPPPGNAPRAFRKAAERMGTRIEIQVTAADAGAADRATDAALAAVTRVEELMSHFRPASDVSRVNAAGGKPCPIDPETLKCLKRALFWSERTDGAFDVTCGPLVDLWGFGIRKSPPEIPSPEAIAAARARTGWRQVDFPAVDSRDSHVRIPPGFSVNLSAIAEGFAIDAAVDALRRDGITQAVVDGGGDLFVLGSPSPDGPGRIGVRHPRDRTRLAGSLLVADAGVATSGDAEKFIEVDGERLSHVIDPGTGRPVAWRGSATVVAPNATDADALATALCVMGPERGTALIEALGDGYACAFLAARPDGTTAKTLSKRMEALWRDE